MAYSEIAVARRRCTGTTKAGQPCRAWAIWDDPRQLCVRHAGRGQTGPLAWPSLNRRLSYREYSELNRAKYPPCRCTAYQWPHRPGGGLCRWPDPPLWRRTTPAGTHSEPRVRRPRWW